MPSIEAASVTPAGRLAAPAWKARKEVNNSVPNGRGSFDRDRRMANHSLVMAESVGCIRCDRFRLFRAAHQESRMSLSLEIETPRLLLRQWRAADRRPPS